MGILDRAGLLEGMRKAVEARGADFIDPNAVNDDCRYVLSRDSDQPLPGCIIGTAIYMQTGEFVDEDYEYMNADHLDEYLTENARKVAYEAQRVQDKGGTWGDALETAYHFDPEL